MILSAWRADEALALSACAGVSSQAVSESQLWDLRDGTREGRFALLGPPPPPAVPDAVKWVGQPEGTRVNRKPYRKEPKEVRARAKEASRLSSSWEMQV